MSATYEELAAEWAARDAAAVRPDPPIRDPHLYNDPWKDAPCARDPHAWRWLSPPDGDAPEIGTDGRQLSEPIDYEHVCAAMRALCRFCPLQTKRLCEALRVCEEEWSASIPPVGVWGGVLYTARGKAMTDEQVEEQGRSQARRDRRAELKRRSRQRLAGGEGTAA